MKWMLNGEVVIIANDATRNERVTLMGRYLSFTGMVFSCLCFSGFICIFGLVLSGMLGAISGVARVASGFIVLLTYFMLVVSGRAKRNRTELVAVACFFWGVLISLINGRSFIEIAYEAPSFSVFILMLPIVFYAFNNSYKSVSRLILLLCLSSYILMVGQVVDYFIPLNQYLGLPDLLDADSTRRSYFLYTSPTMIFAFSSIVFLLVTRFHNKYSLLYLLTLLISSFLSFSRLPFILSVLLFSLYFIMRARVYLKILLILFLSLLFILEYDAFFMYFNGYFLKFGDVFSNYDYGNSIRFELWSEAASKFLDYRFFLGQGFGSSNLNISRQLGSLYLGHFESTFFYYFIELGYFGVFLYMFAMVKALGACQNVFEKLVVIMFFVNISVVPLMVNYQLPFLFWLTIALLTVTKVKIRREE